MGHEVEGAYFDLTLAFLTFLLSTIVSIALYQRKKNTGIRALNQLIYLFISLAMLGLIEFSSIMWHDTIPLLVSNDSNIPIIFSPVRLVNLVAILILYFFAENILEKRQDITRFSILISLLTGIGIIGLISHQMNELVTTNLLIPFASETRLDEFLFDVMQMYVIGFLGYMFWQQYQFSESDRLRKYVKLFLFATILYLGSMIVEVVEHFVSGVQVNAFISAFPTIALLAYIYLRYPNLIYLVPTEVKFLQLITVNSGIPVYVAEFDEKEKKMDFLIGPGLSSIRTMLRELLTADTKQTNGFSLKSFEYNDGYLIFEESAGLFALLQADRLSKVLLTSLAYFITEFEKIFGDQLTPFKGKFIPVNGMTPDDLLRRCVPVVQAKPIISSIERETVKNN